MYTSIYDDEWVMEETEKPCICHGGVLHYLRPGDGPNGLEAAWEYCDCSAGKDAKLQDSLNELNSYNNSKDYDSSNNIDFEF